MTGRPGRLVFVAGTATAVGKTWWSAATARALREQGVAVAARKPVQSCEADEVTDAEILAAATGEDAAVVCLPHRTYRLAWAPPMAAAELGAPAFAVADLVRETSFTTATAVGLVEGVGGPRSPFATDGDNVDFAHALAPDLVVLVADAGLGTINAVRLAAAALDGFPLVVALNRFGTERLHERNRDLLVADGFDVDTSPLQTATRLGP